jgi:NitT/TauT family transport system substrate-binding protein
MKMKLHRAAVHAFAVAILAAGIPSASAQALKEVKLALSFPNGAAWPYLAVAEEMGYFKDEGLKVTIINLNGASASYKAMATGQADYAFSGPAQVLNGLAAGEATKSFYTAYQGHVYQFGTPEDSPYHRIADLKGQKIGISTVAGGQYPYLLATLKNAGLTVGPGKDVEIAEVGRGGAAAVALQQKRIAAYSASFVDLMAIELAGIRMRRFSEGPTATFISDSLIATKETLDKDPKTAIGLARAIAKGTVFCFENQNACWASITKAVPDNGKNPKFTKPLLRYTLELHELGPEAQGRWGYQAPKAWEAIDELLVESGQLKQKVDVSHAYTNDLIGEINRFDAAKVKADARNYKVPAD